VVLSPASIAADWEVSEDLSSIKLLQEAPHSRKGAHATNFPILGLGVVLALR